MPDKRIDPDHYRACTEPAKAVVYDVAGEDINVAEQWLEALYRRGWMIVPISSNGERG